jgi:hypothetical protein
MASFLFALLQLWSLSPVSTRLPETPDDPARASEAYSCYLEALFWNYSWNYYYPLQSSVGDKRVSCVKGWYGVNITFRTTLALNIHLFGNLYYQPLGIRYRYLGVTIHPSKVFYTLDTQIARYLYGYLGVYRPAIGPGRHTASPLTQI